MIDIYGDGKPNKEVDWTESSFTPDYLSARNNNFDTIGEDDLYEEYSDPKTRRRKKTRAPELFAHLDVLDEPLSHSGGELAGLGQSYGTNTRLTKKYNSAERPERNRIKGEFTNAFDWAKAATPEQRNAQMEAVKKAEIYDVTDNQYLYDQTYPNDPQTPAFIPNAGLTDQEDRDYFKSTPEQKQAIIDDLNAQIAPWPTYEPTLDEMGLGPRDDYGYVAPVVEEAVDEPFAAQADEASKDVEGQQSASDLLTIQRPDKTIGTGDAKDDFERVASNLHADSMNDATTAAASSSAREDKQGRMADQYGVEIANGKSGAEAVSGVDELSDLLTVNFDLDAGSEDQDQLTTKQVANLNFDAYFQSPIVRSEAEMADAKRVADALSLGLDTLPRETLGKGSEYQQFAAAALLVPIMVEAGAIAIDAAAVLIARIGGRVVAKKIITKTLEILDSDTELAKPDETKSNETPAGRLEIKADADNKQYFDLVGEEVIRGWLKPLESRGDARTKRGNDIVVQECNAILEAEFPQLKRFNIKHDRGATKNGNGRDVFPEDHLPRLGDPEPGKSERSGFSRPDMSYRQLDHNDKPVKGGARAYINTVSERADGTPTLREERSLRQLLINAGGRLAVAVSKFRGKGDDDEARYRRKVRDSCREIFRDLDRQTRNLKESSDKDDQTKENDDNDTQLKD
ncbi:MAG: hypothetical protein HOK30_14125 [Rhodospirillaceae bacterium]|nr:hypothetical protein [Rhodospirillaceae bacterium]MBT5194439.1 hypothetical protein [Rhodospirillaceae bacterium]MBT5895529.1 hypothetical protein [Rhodospirillaceae bacterium]MBT6428800.1 hypothetical protein [Rhodospirillaceae bacterium]MBT7756223.1 hypothetical protein [Rhodospirillaceae bacterium]